MQEVSVSTEVAPAAEEAESADEMAADIAIHQLPFAIASMSKSVGASVQFAYV